RSRHPIPTQIATAPAIRALPDLCLEIVWQGLENHWPSRQGNLESPGTPGAFFYSPSIGGAEPGGESCSFLVGVETVMTRHTRVRRDKSRAALRLTTGRPGALG